jgi:hypothetical protein
MAMGGLADEHAEAIRCSHGGPVDAAGPFAR